jgi:hypothetical protein
MGHDIDSVSESVFCEVGLWGLVFVKIFLPILTYVWEHLSWTILWDVFRNSLMWDVTKEGRKLTTL